MKVGGIQGNERSITVQSSPAVAKGATAVVPIGLLSLDRHVHLKVLAYLKPNWVKWGGKGGRERERQGGREGGRKKERKRERDEWAFGRTYLKTRVNPSPLSWHPFQWHVRLLEWFQHPQWIGSHLIPPRVFDRHGKWVLSDEARSHPGHDYEGYALPEEEGGKRFEPRYPKSKEDLLALTALRLDECNLSGNQRKEANTLSLLLHCKCTPNLS